MEPSSSPLVASTPKSLDLWFFLDFLLTTGVPKETASKGETVPLSKEPGKNPNSQIPQLQATFQSWLHRESWFHFWIEIPHVWAYQVVLVVKNLSANAGDIRDVGSISGSGRSPGGGHGNPLQYSCLEHPMDRGGWQATVHGVTKSQTWSKQLSTQQATYMILESESTFVTRLILATMHKCVPE